MTPGTMKANDNAAWAGAGQAVLLPDVYQNRWIAIAGVTDACVLWPFGTIHTPKIAPARSLQLYSTAGAKPTFQLLGVL